MSLITYKRIRTQARAYMVSTDVFGRLVKPAMALLKKVAERALAGGVVLKEGSVVHAMRDLSARLYWGN